MTTVEDIKSWLAAGLLDAEIMVEGDGRHFEAIIVSDDFIGKSMLQRQRLVYAVLGDKMDSAIHALSMKTLTLDESSATKEV